MDDPTETFLVSEEYLVERGHFMVVLTGLMAVAITVGIVNMVAQDGETHWLEGALLLAVYLILGIAFYFLP